MVIGAARNASEALSMVQELRPDVVTIDKVKDEVMKKAVLQKFLTHPDIREILISTSPEEIIEATTGDYYWGCGTKGTEKNVLGKILMEVRSTLESEKNK